MLSRILMIGVLSAVTLSASAQAQPQAQAQSSRSSAAAAAPTTDYRAILADPRVQKTLSEKVRGVNVDEAALRASQARPALDISEVRTDLAPQDAPARLSAAELRRLNSGRARPAAGIQLITPEGVKPGVLGTAPALKKPRGLKLPPQPYLDVSAFVEQLHAALSPNVAGYMMRLRKNGNTIATLQWNWAQTPSDASLGWNPDRRMHVASVSKLITGIAMTKLLDAQGISYDAKIAAYLPGYWAQGPNVDDITFRQLLTHRSGFNSNSSDQSFAYMKARIAAGPNAMVGSSDYQNVNFGLCRMLIAVIAGYIDQDAGFGDTFWDDLFWNVISNIAYDDYVQTNIFQPAGVTGASMNKPAAPARAYNFPVSGAGANTGDLTQQSGGVAWHMSVDEVLDVMNELRRGGSIMSASKAQNMLDNSFGLDSGNGVATPAGKLYHKNGRWGGGDGRQEQCVVFFLPEGMELAVFVNSPIGANATSLRSLVQTLYTDNIKTP